jgi:hypothetical protein
MIARQACFRPVAQDGLPLIGRVPQIDGVYVATRTDLQLLAEHSNPPAAIRLRGAMSGTGQTALTLGFNLCPWRDTAPSIGRPQQLLRTGAAAMTDRSDEIPQDLRILVRVVSACTLGLWAFAAGSLIGVFLFS